MATRGRKRYIGPFCGRVLQQGFGLCGRPEGHNGKCASVEALNRRRDANANRYRSDPRGHDYHRRANLWTLYRMTPEDYDELLAGQNGLCAICGTDSPGDGKLYFCVDHNHACCPGQRSCGECVRGLLCSPCNTGIGMFKDSADFLLDAVFYVDPEILNRINAA